MGRSQNRGMPRLDPALPPVWRSASTLQFGATGRVRVVDPRPWQESLVARLRAGMTDAELERFAVETGIAPRRVRGFVTRLAGALETDGPPPPRVVLVSSPDLAAEVVSEVRQRLAAVTTLLPGPAPVPGALPVVLAHDEVDPAVTAGLMRADAPHLPVVLSPEEAHVGPVIVPGNGPCLACLAAARPDRDAAWPMVAGQLLTSRCPPLDPLLVAEAAVLAAQLISCDDAPTDRVAVLRPGSARRTWHVPDVHPRCACRSPAGNATADAASAPAPAPTTVRAYARPA